MSIRNRTHSVPKKKKENREEIIGKCKKKKKGEYREKK